MYYWGMDSKLIEVGPEMYGDFDFAASQCPFSGFHQSILWAKTCEVDGLKTKQFFLLEKGEVIAAGSFIQVGAGDQAFLYCPDGPILDWTNESAISHVENLFSIVLREWGLKKLMFRPRLVTQGSQLSKRYKKSPNDITSKTTRIIRLEGSVDEIWNQMRGSGRRMIRIAQKNEVRVSSAGVEHISIFYDLYLKSAKRNHFDPKSKPAIQFLASGLIKENKGALLIAWVDDKPAAATLITYFGPVATYFLAGTDEDLLESRASSLLIWEAIQKAKETGMEIFDFGGITLDLKNAWFGFSQFKEKFGGEVVDFAGKHWYDLT